MALNYADGQYVHAYSMLNVEWISLSMTVKCHVVNHTDDNASRKLSGKQLIVTYAQKATQNREPCTRG